MFIFHDINAHTPECREGKERDIEFGQLLPTDGAEVPHHHGKRDQYRQNTHSNYADVKINSEDDAARFL